MFVRGIVGREQDRSPSNDVQKQTARIFEQVKDVLGKNDLSPNNIVRIRVYLIAITDWACTVQLQLAEFFGGDIPPCTVTIVSALVEDWMQIEIEVDIFLDIYSK
jgi:enamine deaminase RidA (YjgF/YER057c/UK114 family)